MVRSGGPWTRSVVGVRGPGTVFSGYPKYLTIIGRGQAKYRDLSVASTSIIRIIDLRDTD